MDGLYQLLKIVNIENYGLFVNIKENVNALCHISKLQKKPEQYHLGDYIGGKEIESGIEGKHSAMECPMREKNELFEEYVTSLFRGRSYKRVCC